MLPVGQGLLRLVCQPLTATPSGDARMVGASDPGEPTEPSLNQPAGPADGGLSL